MGRPLIAARARRVGTGIIGIAVSVAAVAVLITVIDVRATADVLARTDLRWVAATVLLVPFQIVLRSLRWRLLLPRRPDGTRPAFVRVMPVLLAGYLGNLILPARLGELARAFLLARRESIGLAPVLGSVLLERVIDLASLALIAVLAAAAAGAPDWMVRGMAIVAIVGLGLVVLLVASGLPRAVAFLARILGTRAGRVRGAVDQVISFGEGASGGGWRSLFAAIVLSTATWFFVAATYWMTASALGLQVPVAGALLIAAVTTLGTAIPSAPANIGTFEVAAVVTATAIGVPAEVALALALLAHAIVTLPFIVAGAGAVAWMSVSLSTVADEAAAALPAGGAESLP